MEARRSSLFDSWGVFALVAVAAILLWRFSERGFGGSPIAVGTPLPPLGAAGWLNMPPGAAFAPAEGKLLVVDCWATWCGPCRAEMPQLAKIARQYGPLGVEFVGLTDELETAPIQSFIDETPGFNWPVGYGAGSFMEALIIRQIPTVILFGPDRRVLWADNGSYGLPAALDKALLRKGKVESGNGTN